MLRYPDGSFDKFRVRSLVGLIPLFAVERLEEEWIEPFKEFPANLNWFLANRRDLVGRGHPPVEHADGKPTHVLTILNQRAAAPAARPRLRPEREFLSRYGIRSLSKAHEAQPVRVRRPERRATSRPRRRSKLKGGNSNWRGPIWFPTTFLLIESLRKLGTAFGTSYHVETPRLGRGADRASTTMARDIADRLIGIFTRDAHRRRPVLRRRAEVPGRSRTGATIALL